MTDHPDYCKLRFEVAKDEDGWPPVASEGVWATPLGNGLYHVENIPWFAVDVAADDVFRGVVDGEGRLLGSREGALVGELHDPGRPVPRRALAR